jgi:hypothetical protein
MVFLIGGGPPRPPLINTTIRYYYIGYVNGLYKVNINTFLTT